MKRLALSSFAVFSIVVLALAMSATPAMADHLEVSISGPGFATVTCSTVSFNQVSCVGGTVSVTVNGTGSTQGAFGMDLQYGVNASASAAGQYVIVVTENDLIGSNLTWQGLVGGTQNSGMNTDFTAFADATNTLFGRATQLCTTGVISTSGIVGGTCTESSPFAGAGSPGFSLTEQVVINVPAGSPEVATGDANLALVPEPGTLLMLASGLFGLASFRRKLKA